MKQNDVVAAISQAVKELKTLRPVYANLLDFYEKLCSAQEASKRTVHLDPLEISDELLAVKRKEGFPLIDSSEFAIDVNSSVALLTEFCRMAADSNAALAQNAEKISQAVTHGSLEPSILFAQVLTGDDDHLQDLAERVQVDKKVLAFAAYASIRPSLTVRAEELSTAYLDKETKWEKGYCPVCGSPPALSILRGEGGQRSLVCALCAYEWQTTRIHCPFCENRQQNRLAYFFSENEKDCRVDVCENCGKYIKTIDTRQMGRAVYPLVEQIATLHLDMLAVERGLKSGVPLWLRH